MNSLLINLMTFFLGLLLGNWLAIGRDKRKEFNDAAQPIRNWLLGEKEFPTTYRKWPTPEEVDKFTQCLSWWKRGRFVEVWEHQSKLRKDLLRTNEYGDSDFTDVHEIKKDVNICLRYTKKK